MKRYVRHNCHFLFGYYHLWVLLMCINQLREFKEQDDPILVKLKSTVEKEYQKLQELVGPSQPSSQLDRCAEDLTMKMYELIRKKIDSAPPSF